MIFTVFLKRYKMFSLRSMCEMRRCLSSLLVKQPKKLSFNARHYAAPKNRFFKKASILQNEGLFEVTLDHRKLKTPQGNVFRVPSEPLARAVASEWDSQKEKIDLSVMFLTGICSTAIDNPGNVNKYQMVDHMIKFLDTDTVLFFSPEEEELYDLQLREWNPVIQWACERFQIEIKPTHDIAGPNVSHESREILRRYFLSYDQWSLHGYSYGVDTLKSVILMLACAERFLSVEKAVLLSRLEEEFQSFMVSGSSLLITTDEVKEDHFKSLAGFTRLWIGKEFALRGRRTENTESKLHKGKRIKKSLKKLKKKEAQ